MLDRVSMAAFLLLSASCLAQQQNAQQTAEAPHLSLRTAPQFLVRIALSHVTLGGATHTCVIIYPDQTFHLEKSKKTSPSAPAKVTYVAEGILTRDEQIQTASIVGDPELEKLDSAAGARKSMTFEKSVDVVYASIPRSSVHVQDLSIVSVDDERLGPAASSLTKLVETIDSRKPLETKNARHDDCHEPNSARPLQK